MPETISTGGSRRRFERFISIETRKRFLAAKEAFAKKFVLVLDHSLKCYGLP